MPQIANSRSLVQDAARRNSVLPRRQGRNADIGIGLEQLVDSIASLSEEDDAIFDTESERSDSSNESILDSHVVRQRQAMR
jgi:hypothetical protein